MCIQTYSQTQLAQLAAKVDKAGAPGWGMQFGGSWFWSWFAPTLLISGWLERTGATSNHQDMLTPQLPSNRLPARTTMMAPLLSKKIKTEA